VYVYDRHIQHVGIMLMRIIVGSLTRQTTVGAIGLWCGARATGVRISVAKWICRKCET